MKDTQIATLLNTVIIPNHFTGDSENDGVTIAEDLRNVVDLGIAVDDLTADDLKSLGEDFAIGVTKNYFDIKAYEAQTYGMMLDENEFGGAVQRIKGRLFTASDSHALNLQNAYADLSAPDYTDGKYYGLTTDAKVYTKSVGYKVKYSVGEEMIKKAFKSADEMRKFIALIENQVENTINLEMTSLAKAVLRKLALTCNGSRKIALMTQYNTEFGLTGTANAITLSNWKTDSDFKIWCMNLIIALKKYMTDYNMKYNDGSVEVFEKASDLRTILLTEFDQALNTTKANVFHNELLSTGGVNETINFWQNGDVNNLIPTIASGSVHDQIVERVKDSGVGVADDVVTINHLVGIIYSRWSCGITSKLLKTSSKPVPEELFITYFNHMDKSYWIDERDSAIILTLA